MHHVRDKINYLNYSRVFDKLLLIVLALIFMSSQLLAHQKKEAVTRILFNERLKTIEIIHRFLIHDAEHAAKKLLEKSADLIDDKVSQGQFADYVLDNFLIVKNTEVALELSTVGFEIDSRYIWIYQETALQSDIESLSITHNALRELWPEQVNLVNLEHTIEHSADGSIEGNKTVRSLVFKGSLQPKTLQLKNKGN